MNMIEKPIGLVKIGSHHYPVYAFPDNGEGEGSGPATCCAGREADRSGDCDRRGERRVAPGEAEAAFDNFIETLEIEERIMRNEAEEAHILGQDVIRRHKASRANGIQWAMLKAIELLELQPDSEASDNERSGRRNVESIHPESKP